VRWRLGQGAPVPSHFGLPFASIIVRWPDIVTAVCHDPNSGLAWISLAALVGLIIQAAFFLRNWRRGDLWWRLGIVYVVLMCCLNEAMWTGAAGGARRLLLPLTLAFNVSARHCRTSLLWLLAGNVALVAGALSFFYPPDPLLDIAPIRAAGFARVVDSGNNWYLAEQSQRHSWSWSKGSARLDIDAWPRSARLLRAEFDLRSLAARTVIVRQAGRELWRGPVGERPVHVRISCQLEQGRAVLDFATDSPAVTADAAPKDRLLAFAVYDLRLTA